MRYRDLKMTSEQLREIIINKTLLKDNSSEVWFNCKSYLLTDASEYDLEEIFKEYYK